MYLHILYHCVVRNDHIISETTVLPVKIASHRYDLVFDGKAIEYAKIWYANVLLIVVTLGLYFPWARVRTLRYVYQHTSLDGHRFDFHGDPRKMCRPTLICCTFIVLYSVASYLSPLSGFLAALSFALLWPAVWRASTYFRLSQTSYRGARFEFTASLGKAYEHVGVPLVLFIFPTAWLGVDKSIFVLHSTWTVIALAALAVWAALYPIILWQARRLLHSHTLFAGQSFKLRLGYSSVLIRFQPVYIAYLVVLVAMFAAAAWVQFDFFEKIGDGLLSQMTYYRVKPVVWLWLLYFVGLWFLVLRSIGVGAAHNMFWSRTIGQGVRLRSKLKAVDIIHLQIINTLILIASLGMSWPWFKMSMLRLRVGSVALESHRPMDKLMAAVSHSSHATSLDIPAEMGVADIGL